MGNLPTHPMIVHFPIVLSILLPIFAIGTLWAIRRSKRARVWALPAVGESLPISPRTPSGHRVERRGFGGRSTRSPGGL